jgi:fructoselysine 6-kinase
MDNTIKIIQFISFKSADGGTTTTFVFKRNYYVQLVFHQLDHNKRGIYFMNLVSFSAITRDYYPQFNYYSPGGNSLNFAIHFKSSTPGSVAIVGAVGKDDIGNFVLEKLKTHNIDIRHVHVVDGNTAQNNIRVDEYGERYGIEGTWKGGVLESYIFTDDDWIFINRFNYAATTAYDPQFKAAAKKLKRNMKLSVDFSHRGDFVLLEKYINIVSIAFFEGKVEFYHSAKRLAQKYPQIPIVLTLGSSGSKAFLGEEEFYLPAPKVTKVLDTTGCGDSYQAAFAYTWFTANNLKLAMMSGTKAAEKTLSHLGAI